MSITILKRDVLPKKENKTFFNSSQQGITTVTHTSEIGEALVDINKDELDHTSQSTIDLRAHLHPAETCAVLCMDALVGLKVLPHSCLTFTRQKKRLSISVNGVGRQQTVDIVTGKKQEDKPLLGTLDKLKGVFGGSEKK
jgi:hypothetical protein